jgi:general secretion pathway protein F
VPIYTFKGLNKTGKEIKDKISADGIGTAKSMIKTKGIMLLSIKEEKSSGSDKSGSSFSFLQKGVSINDLAMMTRQLATLVKAKIQIVDALSALVDQVDSEKLKLVLSEVKQKVNEGTSLAKAFSDYPKIFNNVYVNMVEAGEASGTLEIVLLRLADFSESQVKLKNKITGALFYPFVMLFFGSVMMIGIFTFVIPKITKVFKSMKKELPLPTKVSIWISDTIREDWLFILIAGVVITFLINRYLKTKSGINRWHSVQLKLPIMGTIIKMINVSRFCSTLGTLLSSGVPILTSMRIVINLIPNVHMKEALREAKDSVAEGASLAGPLKKSGYFPSLVTHMISLGEQSGELEPMLAIVSENYEDQVENKLNGLTSVLEPIMMVGMGCAVGFIVASVIMPMMDLYSAR